MQKKELVKTSDDLVKGSLDAFISALSSHPQEFRFVMREGSGNSKMIRDSIKNLTTAFTYEFASFLETESKRRGRKVHDTLLLSQTIVALAFHAGREFIDAQDSERPEIYQRSLRQMKFLTVSAELLAKTSQSEYQTPASI
jgi:hypothetical protein